MNCTYTINEVSCDEFGREISRIDNLREITCTGTHIVYGS